MDTLPPAPDSIQDSPVLAEKVCPDCGESKPLSGFYRDRSHRDGRSTYCAVCSRDRVRARRSQRREEMGDEAWLEYQRDVVRRYRASGRSRDSDQRDAYRAAERRLREAHRDEFDAYLRQERYDRGLPV